MFLHSHRIAAAQTGHDGQREVSAFGHADNNDDFIVEACAKPELQTAERPPLRLGEPFRLIHVNTKCALHSHDIAYAFSADCNEVTGFERRDDNDLWMAETDPTPAAVTPKTAAPATAPVPATSSSTTAVPVTSSPAYAQLVDTLRSCPDEAALATVGATIKLSAGDLSEAELSLLREAYVERRRQLQQTVTSPLAALQAPASPVPGVSVNLPNAFPLCETKNIHALLGLLQ